METAQVNKQIDSIKSAWRNRAQNGARYRIDVLWTYASEDGDKLFAKGDTSAESYNDNDFETKLDDLLRNEAAARITIKFTDRAGRTPDTYTVVLQEAYANRPRISPQATPAVKPRPVSQQPSTQVQPDGQAVSASQFVAGLGKTEEAPIVTPKPKSSPFGNLGGILDFLSGGCDSLGSTDDSTASELDGLRKIFNYRDRQINQAYQMAGLKTQNDELKEQLKKTKENEDELTLKLRQREEELKKLLEDNEKVTAKLKEDLEDAKADRDELKEKLDGINPQVGMSIGALLGQVGANLFTNMAQRGGSGAGLFGALGSILSNMNQPQQPAAPTPPQPETLVEEADDDTDEAQVGDTEEQPATTAPSGDKIDNYAASVGKWLRSQDPETREKFTAILAEITKHPETFKDVYDLTVTQ